jgi:2-aminomuconate deaminase
MTDRPASTLTGTAPPPVGHYPHARRVGGLLFLSGLGPRPADGGPIPDGIEAQCRAVFANVRSVLEAAGSRWEQLVDVTVFLTDIPRDFAAFNHLWAQYFPTDPPCRTTVEVNRLPTPIVIELKCIATVED